METPDCIAVQNLRKSFRKKVAVESLSFRVPRGTVCGLVGPNGSGKTTTIRMLLGLLPPDAGQLTVLGLNPTADSLALRARVGYVPEQHHMYEWMKVRQLLEFTADCYPTWDWQECARVTELLALPQDRKVKQLSRGELAKLALTVALAHHPELLLLDEPTSGLDPLVRREFLEAIIRLIQAGDRTVFFSTHILSDVERVADQVIILNQGRILADDTLENLRARYTKVSFLFATPPGPELQIPGALRLEKGIREWVAMFAGLTPADAGRLATAIGATDFLLQPMTFEDVFVELLRAVPAPAR